MEKVRPLVDKIVRLIIPGITIAEIKFIRKQAPENFIQDGAQKLNVSSPLYVEQFTRKFIFNFEFVRF